MENPRGSPPMAFQPTSNDALGPSLEDTTVMAGHDPQGVISQQAATLDKLHDAFAAERRAWRLEREHLYERIASLEKLLRVGDGHSPAKSPIFSPTNAGGITTSAPRLPSIAEDETPQSLSKRREGAPQSIDIPEIDHTRSKRKSSVGFAESTPTSVKVEEIPTSPSQLNRGQSPPPFNYRLEAGHTPLQAPRPATPPAPHFSMMMTTMDGIDDTPTRNNTRSNTWLPRSNDEDSEKELKGPLNMPELPHMQGETNFTLDMLSKRLEQIEQHPDEADAKPMIFAQPSPGMVSPVEKDSPFSPKTKMRQSSEAPLAPPATASFRPHDLNMSEVPSNALSPLRLSSLSKQTSHDEQVHADFEQGGIKLKKKPSTNFGAPFGQLGGFTPRKQS